MRTRFECDKVENARRRIDLARHSAMDAMVDVMDVPTENVMNPVAAFIPVNRILAYVFYVLICCIALTTTAVCSLQFTLRKVGFGNNGVMPGSLAAAWQASKRGTVRRRSLFALLQRWGVKGVAWELKLFVGYMTLIFFVLSSLD
ncbi:hypothetical protein HPB51_007981 [Rhipicephalus microplus]|uniref:Uncharacterized protein n=1 Tax=Rhipicephalus microplus TaxID=6941 RepID=A0A9J6DM81_RHIMP|nr:hypothetical protein HPB51_007981 [Rhipicephalus microplus]